MTIWALYVLHIGGGTVGLLSGTVAMIYRKGSRGHIAAGKIFVTAMLIMAAAATLLAIVKSQNANVIGGIMAFYLVTTAWLAVRRRERETSVFDGAAALVPLIIGSTLVIGGVQAVQSQLSSKNGVPVGMLFFMGFVALLCGAGDVRILLSGGLSGTKRIVRHLWRMCFALFIATGSFFLGQQKVFPGSWRGSPIWFVLGLLPLALLIYWVLRVRFANTYQLKAIGPVQMLRKSNIAD